MKLIRKTKQRNLDDHYGKSSIKKVNNMNGSYLYLQHFTLSNSLMWEYSSHKSFSLALNNFFF